MLTNILTAPGKFGRATWHLFSPKRFQVHRLVGMFYLAMFITACVMEARGQHNKKMFLLLPLTGFIQAIVASRTFRFLPKADGKTQGYYHETRVMSYDFVVENIFFSGLLLFQSAYMYFNKEIRANPLFLPIEIIGAFLPYHTVRDFFPKSSFRDSTKEGNKYAMVVKFFYVSAKHISGYFVNYLLFLGTFGEDPINEWGNFRKMFILGGWGTTIAMFLQTLKFKRYISAPVAAFLYVGCFPLFWSTYTTLFFVGLQNGWISLLMLLGIAVNFGPRKGQIAFQSFLATVCISVRYGWMSEVSAISVWATVFLCSYLALNNLIF